MSTINQKLGLKPKSKKRAATHASALATSVSCPSCAGAHCIRTQSKNGQAAGEFMCGTCSAFFDGAETSAEEQQVPA